MTTSEGPTPMVPAGSEPHPAQNKPSRSRNAAATRSALLDAARRRFSVLGYDRTRTRDIAADVGVDVALVNRYFGSKDGLVEAVLMEQMEQPLIGEASTPEDVLSRLLHTVDRESWQHLDGQHPLLLFLRDVGDDPRVTHLRQQAARRFAASLQEDTPPDENADELSAQLMMAMALGIIVLREIVPIEPLASAPTEDLRAQLERVVTALHHTPASQPQPPE
jgi:AcrR family transcriptional regulator